MATSRHRPGNTSVEPLTSTTEDITAIWFVLTVWLCLTIVALGFVAFYGNHTPRWEDWFLVPVITDAQRVDLTWLWENVQGHRLPILKLVFLACYSAFGFDLKPILYLNVLLFSALSLALLWAIHNLRGRLCYSDACLPIILLNLGQTEAFSWAQTFLYVATTCLETLVLILIVVNRGVLHRTSLILVGTSLILLPLLFGGGLVFAATMAPWLLYQGWVRSRTNGIDHHARTIALAFGSITVCIVGLYFVNYHPYKATPIEWYVEPGLAVYAVTALKYLASALGGAAPIPWWKLPVALIGLVYLTTTLCLMVALARQRLITDPMALSLACYMLACLIVAAAVATGRYQWGNAILDSRYAALSVTGLIASYFIWELYGMRALVPPGRMFLFITVAGFLHSNLQLGVRQAVARRDAERAFLHDLHAKQPIPRLVAHHAWITYYYHDHLERYLRQLRDAGIPPYNQLPLDSTLSTSTLSFESVTTHQVDWDGDTGTVLGPDAYLQFDLNKPQFITGLKFRFSLLEPAEIVSALKVQWYSQSKAQLQQYIAPYSPSAGNEAKVLVYIDDTISKLLILPNNCPSTFRMSKIELLRPAGN